MPVKQNGSYLKKRNIILFIFLFLLISPAGLINIEVLAQNKIKPPSRTESNPIEISSDRMRSLESGQKIIFSGNVVATWGDLEIKADVLEIHNVPKKRSTKKLAKGNIGGAQNLEEIVAIGNVHITRGNKKAKGDRAVYYEKQQKIVLTGSPKAVAWEDKNMMEGEEMTFYLESDRIVVNGRVGMIFYPNKSGSKKKKSRK